MEKEELPAKESTEKIKKIRGAFPRVGLKKVLELTDAIFEEGNGDPIRRRDALEKINRSPDSSNSVILIQAANAGYSLISGNKNSSHLELNEKSKTISDPTTSTPTKYSEIYSVLNSNSFFKAIINKYKDRPFPSDTIAIDYLVREQKIPQPDAEACWSVIKENITDFNIFEDSNGKKIIIDTDYALTKLGKAESTIETKKTEKEIENKTNVKEHPAAIEDIKTYSTMPKKSFKLTPQVTFNIQIVLPENASPETYEAIFASMSAHLLGRNEEE